MSAYLVFLKYSHFPASIQSYSDPYQIGATPFKCYFDHSDVPHYYNFYNDIRIYKRALRQDQMTMLYHLEN